MRFPRLFGRASRPAPIRTPPPVTAAVARETRLAVPAQVRGFRAARPDRLLGGWSAGFAPTPRAELRQDIRALVNHARQAAQNYDHARAFEIMARDNVVGHEGIRMVPDVRHGIEDGRGLAGKPDGMANERIAEAWAEWGRKGNCTPCGRLSWWDVERQAVTALVREGGMFLRHHVGRGPFGYLVEPIPFDLLDIDLTERRGAAYIESGIEFDADGRPIAYHLWSAPSLEAHRPGHAVRRRVPAREIIHLMDHDEIGAALGYPRTATALRMMGLSEQFEESAIVAADMGARGVVYYEQEGGTEIGAGIDKDEAPPPLEAGTAQLLPPGVKANHPQSQYPDAAIAPFMQHMGRAEAAGLGVSYESLTADMSGANYSTLVAGLVKERDMWRSLQRVLVEGLSEPVRAAWLMPAMMSGRLKLPVRRFDKFNRAQWRPRGWSAVDPVKQANADTAGIATRTATLSEIAARKGRTVEELAAEIARDRAAFAALGLGDPYAQPGPMAPDGPAAPRPKDKETPRDDAAD